MVMWTIYFAEKKKNENYVQNVWMQGIFIEFYYSVSGLHNKFIPFLNFDLNFIALVHVCIFGTNANGSLKDTRL